MIHKRFLLTSMILVTLLLSVAGATVRGRPANSDLPANANAPGRRLALQLAEGLASTAGACPGQGPGGEIRVEFVGSTYPIASGGTTGFFETGQDADILLSGIDFNNTGGPLLFNHLGGVASDGTRLLLADRFNNRVLIWNSLPAGNEAPGSAPQQLI